MKPKSLIFAALIQICLAGHAQDASIPKFSIGFTTSQATITKDLDDDVIKPFIIQLKDLDTSHQYDIRYKVSSGESNLAESEYSIAISRENYLSQKQSTCEALLFLTIKNDSLYDRQRKLVIVLVVYGKSKEGKEFKKYDKFNLAEKDRLTVYIESPEQGLVDYQYLSYVGTNFDLIDGIETNKLFFASNIFIPNKSSKRWKSGAYFSLYGNRPFSSTDTSSYQNRIIDYIATSNDSIYQKVSGTIDQVTSYSSDNLGAQAMLLMSLGKASRSTNNLQLWLAPSIEFIWRRSSTNISTSNIRDTDTTSVSIPSGSVVGLSPINYSFYSSQYEFNYGVGLFLNHSNENISIRFTGVIGRINTYSLMHNTTIKNEANYAKGRTDWFSSLKLWITEPKSGLTLQADVYNRYNEPNPYYVVTLSKAINMDKLGDIFSPLSTRASK